MSQDEIKIVKFKQELPPQWFLLLIGPDIFSVTTWIPNTDFNTATSPSPKFTQAGDSHFMLMVV